ncbi:hypothetical protein LY76DRAFT_588598 [Colletotrichum caudatum]|nr:hypothetical protein LY76DRAFT_588598 [Colletotrichum caudatum]
MPSSGVQPSLASPRLAWLSKETTSWLWRSQDKLVCNDDEEGIFPPLWQLRPVQPFRGQRIQSRLVASRHFTQPNVPPFHVDNTPAFLHPRSPLMRQCCHVPRPSELRRTPVSS